MKNLLLAFLFLTVCAVSATPEKIENFSLKDYNGKSVSLEDFKAAKAIVIMFIATQCPVSNAYNDRYNELYAMYANKNIAFVAINANKAEDVEKIKAHAVEHEFKFPILKDVNNIIADKFTAERTPEIFVLDPRTFSVLYHGRIDDSQRVDKVTEHDLQTALDEILAGKKVSMKETKAFGCTIKRVQE